MKATPKTLAVGSNNPNKQVSVDVWNEGHNVHGLTRAEVQALTPTAGQIAHVKEDGRDGIFRFESSNHSANVTRDPAQGVYLPPTSDTSGASGAWVRKYDGHLNAAWFGGLPGADLAPVMRDIQTFAGDTALDVYLPPSATPYLWNSKVDWAAPVNLFSGTISAPLSGVNAGFLHSARIEVPSGVTAIVPQRTASIYADFCSFRGLTFVATGQNTTTTTGSMTASSATLTVADGSNFANGQVVRVRGAGSAGTLQGGLGGSGLTGTTSVGSPTITTNIEHAAAVGMVLRVGSAFPDGTRVTAVDRAAKTITMSANATAATTAAVTYWGDIWGYIRSGGGTTTLVLTSAAHRDITGAVVEHYDCAFYGTGAYNLFGITAEGFRGATAFMGSGGRYVNPDGTDANANGVHWDGVITRTGTNGVVIDGTDANACEFANISTLSTTEFGIIDASFLGNLWNNTHTSGSFGILHVVDSASLSQFNYAYTEVGTLNSFATAASGMGYQSAAEDGGIRFIPSNGIMGAPPMMLYPLNHSIQWQTGNPRASGFGVLSGNLSGIGGSASFQALASDLTGLVRFADYTGNASLFAMTMGNHALGAGHTLVSSLYVGDGTEAASAITTSKYRSLRTGSAAPVSGTWAQGDVVINNAPTAGSTLYWRCTVAGTPGTWEAIAAPGVTDGDKGDVVVSGSGATWRVESAIPPGGTFAVTGAQTITGSFTTSDKIIANSGATFSAPSVGQGYFYAHSADGLFFAGNGTATDMLFANKNGATVIDIPTGTTRTRLAGDCEVGGVVKVAATQVVSTRKTGWAAATGTATRTTFDTTTVTTAQLAERVKALLDDLISHGLVGT